MTIITLTDEDGNVMSVDAKALADALAPATDYSPEARLVGEFIAKTQPREMVLLPNLDIRVHSDGKIVFDWDWTEALDRSYLSEVQNPLEEEEAEKIGRTVMAFIYQIAFGGEIVNGELVLNGEDGEEEL